MLIHLLNNCTPSEKERIRIFLSTPREKRNCDDVQWIYGLIEKYGCIEYARNIARELAQESLKEFDMAYALAPDSEDKRFIKQIVVYMIERQL